ncbi:hypothetical protein [Thermococcus sp.]|nr:hypothetical protein [Thermococcus sp.]
MKKLAVAQAFIGEPELIMIDEPFTSVDFNTMVEFLKLFKRLRDGTIFS